MAAEVILTKVNTTTCNSVNDTFNDDTFVIDESIDDDKEKDISQEIITDLVDNIVASSKEEGQTTPPVAQEETAVAIDTGMNTSCAQKVYNHISTSPDQPILINCKNYAPIPMNEYVLQLFLAIYTVHMSMFLRG